MRFPISAAQLTYLTCESIVDIGTVAASSTASFPDPSTAFTVESLASKGMAASMGLIMVGIARLLVVQVI